MLKLVISEACRYTCQQLRDLRCSWLPEPGVRDVIRSLGCARRRRGRRSGNRAGALKMQDQKMEDRKM